MLAEKSQQGIAKYCSTANEMAQKCLKSRLRKVDLCLNKLGMEVIAIVGLQRGISSKRESSARVDYVSALCTHRPLLLPIEWSGEVFG
ncbi:Unknown protein [Striga hermonthica]|uniref:Uncharacterized protein n=1 Tax=Striga hermonthica TaxID=68872 RepID=A0A9N7REC2_STRHE|nr:Unknown protein [Striga hermonthica]